MDIEFYTIYCYWHAAEQVFAFAILYGLVQNMDSGLWTGLWTEIWTGFWTDTQFNDDHFQHSVALNGLGYALATAYPVCSKTRLLFMPF